MLHFLDSGPKQRYAKEGARQLMGQMDPSLLFRWFVGPRIDDTVGVSTVITKARDRLLTTDMSRRITAATLAHQDVAPPLSDHHYSDDGTLVRVRAAMKDFQPQDKVMSEVFPENRAA